MIFAITDPYALLYIIGSITFLAIVAALILAYAGDRKRKRMQQFIDESHMLGYRKWRDIVARTGEIAPISTPLMLAKDEECLWVERNVTLYEVRAVRHSTHTFATVPLGKSGIRVGRGYSTSESSDEWRPIARGQLYITNKQIYFDGDKHDRKVPLDKLSTIKSGWSEIEVSADTGQKSMVFIGLNGKICEDIVKCACGQDVFGASADDIDMLA